MNGVSDKLFWLLVYAAISFLKNCLFEFNNKDALAKLPLKFNKDTDLDYLMFLINQKVKSN